MGLVNLISSVVSGLISFASAYFRWGIAAVALLLFVIALIRFWPDRAAMLFIVRNVRVTGHKLADVRERVASIVGYEIHESQRAIATQQLKVQALQLEVARLRQIVNVKSVSMLVGEKLQAIEKDHLFRLRTLDSEQAREALRRVTEKEINDLLQSLDVSADSMPEFHFRRIEEDSKPEGIVRKVVDPTGRHPWSASDPPR